MGEVYRASDLKLNQPVALKFLPEVMARNERLLARFHGEVRIARQVSHPNACRVYDIGELDGSAEGVHALCHRRAGPAKGEILDPLVPGPRAMNVCRYTTGLLPESKTG
jgi:serine/threonine protein kinase